MGWIPVTKDTMPPPNTDVLIWVAEDRNVHEIGRWDPEDPSCNGWDTNHDLLKYREITHWMPLPEPPTP